MVKLYLYVLTVVLAAAPAYSLISNEYERRSSELDRIQYGREFVDSRDSAVFYGRDLDFEDPLWIRSSLGAVSLARLIAGTAAHHTWNAIVTHGGTALSSAKTVSDIVANGYAAYHNGNPNNSNKPAHPASSDVTVHVVRELGYDQELSGRDIDDEERFAREDYGLDELDIIDELD